ncbi:hypothetical protein HAV22_21460 [Massilia sp. TW-1]|uniref:PelD GGDEF domain-containing protein n=1 Tax=Telluria antibiotica TaxID=2717319 RepID=A0ABX0PIG7_9BURK|nr:PelD GGDEF domain-containing protein [Telluria antibiotica]NIA56203.1 hypothetical protein [Telluria antibiotica]
MRDHDQPLIEDPPARQPLLRRAFPDTRKDPVAEPAVWIGRAIESTLMCLAGVALNGWINPADPLGVHAQFPWLWTIPVLVAMRYGTSIAILASMVFLATWLALRALHPSVDLTGGVRAERFPHAFFVGGTIWTLICGQFSDVWSDRHRRVLAANLYFKERLQIVTRNHFLLRLSHERLERDMLSKTLTLRETLQRLRAITQKEHRSGNTLPGIDDFLRVVAQGCQFEAAAVHRIIHDGWVEATPHAYLGPKATLDVNDPMVRQCMSVRKLSHLRNIDASEQTSRYVACAPLQSSSGQLLGVLAVSKMPFIALNTGNLQLMTVLAGYYADGVEHEHAAAAIVTRFPDIPNEFALELVRLCRTRRDAGIASSMVAHVFDDTEQGQALFEQVRSLRRSIDMQWAFSDQHHRLAITLLPMTGIEAVQGYILRIESALKRYPGTQTPSAHIGTHTVQLGRLSSGDTLARLLEKCHE